MIDIEMFYIISRFHIIKNINILRIVTQIYTILKLKMKLLALIYPFLSGLCGSLAGSFGNNII